MQSQDEAFNKIVSMVMEEQRKKEEMKEFLEERALHTMGCEICLGFCNVMKWEEMTLFPRMGTDHYWNKHEAHLREHGFIWHPSALSKFRGIIEIEELHTNADS